MSWDEWARAQNALIEEAGQWRAPRVFDARGPVGQLADGRQVVSFASNDYLGLASHPAVTAAAHAAIDRWGTGAGAARLVVGSRPIHDDLEAALADWKGCERAVLFPTGYQANLGVLTTFGGPGVRVCSDELNHASIIDGCRLSRAEVAVYRHGDLDHLDRLLADCERAVVVSDTVFSMDGDVADIEGLLRLCRDRDALLVLDEAHAVLGPDVDVAALVPPRDPVVVRIGTLSKTLGSLGGFAAASGAVTDLLVNRARPYIFTTASSPPDAAAALAAVHVVCSGEGDRLRAHLRALVDLVRPGHPSPILPVIVGDEVDALAASAELLDRGLLVPAIRPPTVAEGTSRLRVALSAAHEETQVRTLVAALTELGLDRRVAAA